MRERRISEIISNIDEKYVNEAAGGFLDVKRVRQTGWVKWCAAACLMFAVILGTGIFWSSLQGEKKHTAILEDGSTIYFVKSDEAAQQRSDIAFQVETHDLAESEISSLFHGLPVTDVHAFFRKEDGSIVGVEGVVRNVKLKVSAHDAVFHDTVVEGRENLSFVGGVSVNAGYFVTNANSQGEKTIIYYASFELGECSVYLECAGVDVKEEAVKNEIAAAIRDVISLGEINLSEIRK